MRDRKVTSSGDFKAIVDIILVTIIAKMPFCMLQLCNCFHSQNLPHLHVSVLEKTTVNYLLLQLCSSPPSEQSAS